MNLAALSIKRPVFITCLVMMMLALGWLSLKKLPVDMFPDVNFPFVMVITPYPGAGPAEVETLISKVFENELSSLPGLKSVSSVSKEGLSNVFAEFTLETDVKYAEQQIRDRVSAAKYKLPKDAKEPIIRRMDPADQPILVLTLAADLSETQLYELANETIKPRIEQVAQVGLVSIVGGRKREIQVQLDRSRLKNYQLSATRVTQALASAGQNIPAGNVNRGQTETIIRTLGEFKSMDEVGSTIVSFFGNDNPVRLTDVGKIVDTLEDEKTRGYINGHKTLFLYVYRQSGANTIAVVKAVKKRVAKLNVELEGLPGKPQLASVRDGSQKIKANVIDVQESILIGILLTILVVYLFLGNGRSTLITSMALPNSLIGAFFLMSVAGFSINVMTLLGLSLSVGLLIDDAIVVRENIFRHIEMGKTAIVAAVEGTQEVLLAVVATTLTVIAVFGPIAFLQGIVGQFFKQFGLTICFIMLISLFDALTVAPMLSAYLAGRDKRRKNFTYYIVGWAAEAFGHFQDFLEARYARLLGFTLRHPLVIILLAIGVFMGSMVAVKHVPKTFLPVQDFGEFIVSLELPPGASLDAMQGVATQVDELLRKHPEVAMSVMTIGNADGEANTTELYVELVPAKQRSVDTSMFKQSIRNELKAFSHAKPIVKDVDIVGGGQRPFNLNIVGQDMDELQKVAQQVFERLKNHPALLDMEISYKGGKPEFQIAPDTQKAMALGISNVALGYELRTLVEGQVPAVFRENGLEYDIRVRLQDNQRDLKSGFNETYVPNINQSLIRLPQVAQAVETVGPAQISRQDRGRYIQLSADIAPQGPGIGGAMQDIRKMFETDIKLPKGMRYQFVGQAESFQELLENIVIAAGLGILFIYLVLSSLYESFITPFTIMLVLPLAICGAFFALFITQHSLDIFSMIGCIMLLGVATKNSILLVDFTHQQMEKGIAENEALIQAGRARLRPILMTTAALISGMLPIAIGLNEASKQRTSMGIAIIGGLISSTLLTLVVIPAAFRYIESFRRFSSRVMKKVFITGA